MKEYKKFTKEVGILAFARFLMKIKGLILVPLLAKTLGASPYGIYVTLMVTVDLLVAFSSMQLSGSMLRFLSNERDKKIIQEGYYSILVFVFGLSIISASLVFFFASTLANTFFGDPQAVEIIKVGAIMVVVWTLNLINMEFFKTFRRILLFSFFEVSQALLEVGFALFLVFSGFGIKEVIYSFLAVRILVFLITSFIITNNIGLHIPNFSRLKFFLLFSIPILPSKLASWVTQLSDRYIIGFFLNSAAIGIYSAAYSLGFVGLFFIEPLTISLLPALSQLWEEGKINELKNHFKYSLKYFLTFAVPSVFGLTVLSESLLTILTQPEFVSEGGIIMPIAAISALMYGVGIINSKIFFLRDDTRRLAIVWFIAAFLNIVLNVVGIPIIGILAAVLSTLFSFSFVAFVSSYVLFKELELLPDVLFIIKSFIASLIMCFFVLLMHFETFPEILLPIFLGATVYFLVLFFLKGFKESEIRFFKEAIKRVV